MTETANISAAAVLPNTAVVPSSNPISLKDVIATLEMARTISDGNNRPVGGYVLKFSEPVCFSLGGRYYRDTKKFRFRAYKHEDGRLYFSVTRRARWMHELPYRVEQKITSVRRPSINATGHPSPSRV